MGLPSRSLRPRRKVSLQILMGFGNGTRGVIPIRATLLICPRPRQGWIVTSSIGHKNSFEEKKGLRDGIVNKIQGFWWDKENFDQRMDILGLWGEERGGLVTSDLKELLGTFESFKGKPRWPYRW